MWNVLILRICVTMGVFNACLFYCVQQFTWQEGRSGWKFELGVHLQDAIVQPNVLTTCPLGQTLVHVSAGQTTIINLLISRKNYFISYEQYEKG